MSDYYERLKLSTLATGEEITQAYLRERARLQAAADPSQVEVQEQFLALEEAYATLSDPDQRNAYDHRFIARRDEDALALSRPQPIQAPSHLQAPEVQQPCPSCGALNPIQATICATCNQHISIPCPNCGRPVMVGQQLCARCGTVLPEYLQRRAIEAQVTGEETRHRRIERDSQTQAMEQTHRVNAVQGVIFWLIVFAVVAVLVVICAVAFLLPLSIF